MNTRLPTHVKRPLVAPSVLASDFGAMADDARDVIDRGADLLHVDIMDGHFVPNLSMGPDTVAALRRVLPQVLLDVHLMVTQPERFIEPFAKAGASHISFHLEVVHPFHPAGLPAAALLDRIHDLGLTAGMVVNPYTHPAPLLDFVDHLDMVLMMSVVPGYGGQAFLSQVLDNTAWLRDRLPSRVRLEMDGGLTLETAPAAVAAGVDMLVAGSSVFKAADRTATIQGLAALPLARRNM